jgi:hypothetical protein
MRIGFLLLSLLLLVAAPASFSQSKSRIEKEKLLKLCAENFGEPVDKGLNLYEANSFYVLHAVFDKKNKLEKLEIVPRYYFAESHPEWEEPEEFENLSWSQFQNFLTRVDLIKPKGELITPSPNVSIVTNQTAPFTTVYKNAQITVGYLLDLNERESAEIKWFLVEFGKRAGKDDSTLTFDLKAWDEMLKKKKSEGQH